MDKKLNNLMNWVTKRGMEGEPVKFGDQHYFKNASYIYDVIQLDISDMSIAGINKKISAVNKYCKRYNLDIFRECNLQSYYDGTYHKAFFIRTPEDAEGVERYYIYHDKSVEECEQLAHDYYIRGIHETHSKELNEQMKAIMAGYEAQYKRSLLKTA